MTSISKEEFTNQKNKWKKIKVVVQVLILLVVVVTCIMALFTLKTYKPYAEQTTTISEDKGFIALSYFGVDRIGNQNLIGQQRLQEHLQALKNLGYVTITQQDIVDYYQLGKDLPEKALFLMFEDGRRDTAIFSQKILEDLNYKATMVTYPEKFEKKDPKFLMPEELIGLEKTTFWEMGTNGYRLEFINVFDRYDTYVGQLDPLKHAKMAPFLGRKYNHYLMDYIRDEDGIPKENYMQMKERITYDYQAVRDIYTKSMGYIPGTYVLMHSNTGSFGNNDKVSAVNEYWMNKLFNMNFNREGFSLNQRDSSIYDLTRMQPQAYWYTNHLLMRIKYDIEQDVEFVKGDLAKQEAWDTLSGALEIQDETMILTSLPQDTALARLKTSLDVDDMKLSVRLKGNKLGVQKIYLKADEDVQHFLSVAIHNNVLSVTEQLGDAEQELFALQLDEHDGKMPISIQEDQKAADMNRLETFAKYADSVEQAKRYAEELNEKSQEIPSTVPEGGNEYIPDLGVNEKGDRMLSLSLKDNQLSIVVDGKEAVANLPVTAIAPGAVCLGTSWGGYGWSQRNLADDVYDGVFEQLIITENKGVEQENILFDSRIQGFEGFKFKAKQQWEKVLGWFIAKL